MYHALENGGRAIILVPNDPSLMGTLDEVLGHCRRYTPEQLISVGQQAGFRIEKLVKFNRAGVPAWWLNGKMLRRTTFGMFQIRALNVLTPIFRRIDTVLPFQPLSIIAVFRKEDSRSDALVS